MPARRRRRSPSRHRLRAVEGMAVVLVNDGGRLHALEDRCTHRGGALHDGELRDGCLVCPLHGSAFRIADGSVERGPAAYPQPASKCAPRATACRSGPRRPPAEGHPERAARPHATPRAAPRSAPHATPRTAAHAPPAGGR